jgi:hypothetical protein
MAVNLYAAGRTEFLRRIRGRAANGKEVRRHELDH